MCGVLVLHCWTTHLFSAGMHEVGIFRLPGQATLVSELREKFNQGELFGRSLTAEGGRVQCEHGWLQYPSQHTHTACAISSPTPHHPTPLTPHTCMYVLCATLPHDPHNHVTLSMPLPPTHIPHATYVRTYIYLVYLLPIKHYYPFAYHHPHHHPTARTTPAYLHMSLTHTPAYDPHPHVCTFTLSFSCKKYTFSKL